MYCLFWNILAAREGQGVLQFEGAPVIRQSLLREPARLG